MPDLTRYKIVSQLNFKTLHFPLNAAVINRKTARRINKKDGNECYYISREILFERIYGFVNVPYICTSQTKYCFLCSRMKRIYFEKALNV